MADNGQVTATEARAILQQETQEREKACWAEIEKVLAQFNCRLDVTVILKTNQVVPRVGVVSNPPHP
jgi:hypothetical protein